METYYNIGSIVYVKYMQGDIEKNEVCCIAFNDTFAVHIAYQLNLKH